MLKTITQLEPFIYARMFAQPRERRARRWNCVRLTRFLLVPVYVALSLKITVDTGIPPWDCRHWLMLGPVFLFGERVLWALMPRVAEPAVVAPRLVVLLSPSWHETPQQPAEELAEAA